eukprot:4569156-Prorocentrum_lima.AAC.1
MMPRAVDATCVAWGVRDAPRRSVAMPAPARSAPSPGREWWDGPAPASPRAPATPWCYTTCGPGPLLERTSGSMPGRSPVILS